VKNETLARLALYPLSFMEAPERPEPMDGPRIARERLGAFLRRPASLQPAETGRPPRMMAYPTLSRGELGRIAALLGVRASPAAIAPLGATRRRRAEQIWQTRCAPCHDGEHPLSGRGPAALSLYTADWLGRYARGDADTPGRTLKMPVIELSRAEAADLYALLGEKRHELEQRLDADVARLSLGTDTADVPDSFVAYLWGPFFREATCVHCHAGVGRAGRAFRADADGLADYLRRKSGVEIWRRLQTRALEARYGLGAREPGMPMAGGELPEPLRALVARWVRAGCQDPRGQRHCSDLAAEETRTDWRQSQ
jgi:mono/diheme cytochrome c family protein